MYYPLLYTPFAPFSLITIFLNCFNLIDLSIHLYCRLLGTIDDPVRRMKWQQIQGEVAEVRIISTFSSFACAKVILNYHA
jgi:hypothetical protein